MTSKVICFLRLALDSGSDLIGFAKFFKKVYPDPIRSRSGKDPGTGLYNCASFYFFTYVSESEKVHFFIFYLRIILITNFINSSVHYKFIEKCSKLIWLTLCSICVTLIISIRYHYIPKILLSFIWNTARPYLKCIVCKGHWTKFLN
jgi:hypothetical protein